MDKILEQAKSLREDINNLPEVKEYYRLKELYENDKELERMRQEIARLKSKGLEEEKNNLLKIYNSHPLVNNFNQAKQEVEHLLLAVKEIID